MKVRAITNVRDDLYVVDEDGNLYRYYLIKGSWTWEPVALPEVPADAEIVVANDPDLDEDDE